MSKRDLFLKAILPLFLIGLMGLYLLWNTVPSRLSKSLTSAFGTPVFIGNATFNPKKIGFSQISVSSPKNSILPQAFSCESLNVHAWVGQYLKEEIVIDLVELDTVYLGLEFDSPSSTDGNWTRLMGNLQASSSAHDSSSHKSVTIKKLIIRNITCQVVYANKKARPINLKPIPVLEFDDISSSSGFPIEQLSNSVLGKMLKEVFVRENLNDMLNKWVQPQKQLDNLLKPFKLF